MAWDRIAIFLIIVLVCVIVTKIGRMIYQAGVYRGTQDQKRDEYKRIERAEAASYEVGRKTGYHQASGMIQQTLKDRAP